MAGEHYKKLEEMNDSLWFEGSPIILSAMRLEVDTKSGAMYASAKFLNIQPDNLRSLTADIICYDEGRNIIDCMTDITYGGLDVARNSDFGYNRRIQINDVNTRSVEFVVRVVTNIYNQTWENSAGKRFNKKIEQRSIYDLQGEYNKQFLNVCAKSGIDGSLLVFEPVFKSSHWLCACGAFNWSNDKVCSQCKAGRSWLEKSIQIETLEKQKQLQMKESQQMIEHMQSRVNEEADKEHEKEEFRKRKLAFEIQQKKQKSKKAVKKLIIAILILVVLGAAAYGLFGFLIPYIRYSEAVGHAENGEYDKAIGEFKELGDFMDSEDRVIQTRYDKASDLLRAGKYEEAAAIYEGILGFSDSRERYNNCIYNIGLKQMEDNSKAKDKAGYYDAIETLNKVGTYKDAKDKINECLEILYNEATGYIGKGNYEAAFKKLEALKKYDYKDVQTKIDECNYYLAKKYMNMQHYAKALDCYKAANGFKDSAEKLKQNMMLAAIISSATDKEPAEWANDIVTCSKCKQDSASFSLSFSRDGKMYSSFDCKKHKVSDEEKNARYRFKIENDAIYQMDYDGKTKWVKYADIYSFKPTGKGDQYEMIISDPLDPKSKLSVYGSVVKE